MTETAELLARHSSPDGRLTLVVERVHETDGPLVVVGFLEGSGWHFHPTEEEALRIVGEVLADHVVIMEWTNGERSDIELMEDLDFEVDGAADGTSYRFRLWSGPVSFEDLAAGKVPYVPLWDLWNWRT